MTHRGYDTIEIIDEDYEDSRPMIDALKGRDVVLITSDHLNDNMKYYGKEGYSIKESCDLLRPKKKYFGMHDLGISTVDDDVTGYHILAPDDAYQMLFNGKKHIGFDCVGHPKFVADRTVIKYDAVFFVSSVYVYAKAPIDSFYNAFKLLFDRKVSFKFPKYSLSTDLIHYARSKDIDIINPDIESFEILQQTKTAISNANSSIAIEASMAGCKSINLGWDYKPSMIYDKYNVISVNEPSINGLKEEHLSIVDLKRSQMSDMKFNMDKAIKIITSDI